MRDILFRGKRVDGKGWAYGSLILSEGFCCILEAQKDVHPLDYPYLDNDMGIIDGYVTPVIPKTIGEFTELCDCKYKKIFEGDILENQIVPESLKPITKCLIVVTDIRKIDRMHLYVNQYKVVGNIHDNPELLEEA